ncbi:MAG: hypothetical protein EXR78_01235 [Deltaproteobacteria bacterium]|nr:hypothetical protein [Deltaproteobacteria bacterium]
MAKVWFVRPQNKMIALGGKPAYQGEMQQLIWPLDLGLHRFHGPIPLVPNDETPQEFAPEDKVFVEVTADDMKMGTSYQVGFYSSPYSPKAAIARLGQPYQG